MTQAVFQVMRRRPKQDRAGVRILKVLKAAGVVLTEKGAAGLTMGDVADAALSSIGSIYNYFPSKERLLEVLHVQYEDEFQRRWSAFEERARGLDLDKFADEFVHLHLNFSHEFPAFYELAALHEGHVKTDFAQAIAVFLFNRFPALTGEEALRVGMTLLEFIRPLSQPHVSGDGRDIIRSELREAVYAYLEYRLARVR